ncbi:DUF4623 domain-containing protein [Membranicola marinus]|uniref:DUF4623 domain-containing protein n=1 Tax=Membranihabitans marinus TaxID=1227546 RepID=A0A953HNU4_9BACT|nr:DUF4623 domain-containing protein [Membranihabitans marinus]MBY5959424.1 DUF4623 domain-containing protein [Membranihabitans marinus]
MIKIISKYWVLAAFAILVSSISCEKDFPQNIESPDGVLLKSISIVNAGADGNQVIPGEIDEVQKTVSFPRLDTLTDFSNLKFEAEMSDGAMLDKESYEVDFEEGAASKTIIVKVVNNKRFREYLVTIRLLIPVFGADFTSPVIYDNTNNDQGNPIYPSFVSLLTRGTGFDGEHVLIVTRHELGSHLLSVEDLRQNKVEPIPLNLTGVSGGTFPINVGAQVNGHTYIANLSGGHASPFKIYHWTDPSAEPEVIADINTGEIPELGSRHGDNMSANLDEDGNGYFYFGDNAVTTILRLTVTNYTTISDPVVLPNAFGSSFVMSFNQIGNGDNYLFTGYDAPIRVANESADVSYSLSNDAVPIRGCDARIVNFNGERYLIMTTAARSGSDPVVLYVYDITKGKDAVEALQIFDERADKSPIYQYSLLGPANPAPGTQSGWHITKDAEGNDEKLTLYGASANAGFVVIDFPKKKSD